MKQPDDFGVFKPTLSRGETKAEMTDRTVKEFLDKEAAATEAKTARLRAARLALEAERAANPPPPEAKPAKKTAAKKAAPKRAKSAA
ncbi:topoisomerase IA-like protein [Rhizomicrobium palustre]|uniref:Topoisomerase IA-like protein n=1 Tax=Rhizomicrobium palustre TaxID=189966 RepID=A0A846N4T2_9PROT|nr:hypothetical protein [Rhizomicrobium palustre]NIK90192.1 topoisomerase IA-like protein [Rhizomicrobium palustre]